MRLDDEYKRLEKQEATLKEKEIEDRKEKIRETRKERQNVSDKMQSLKRNISEEKK